MTNYEKINELVMMAAKAIERDSQLRHKYAALIAQQEQIVNGLNVQITNEEDSAVRLAELRASKEKALALIEAYAQFVKELSA